MLESPMDSLGAREQNLFDLGVEHWKGDGLVGVCPVVEGTARDLFDEDVGVNVLERVELIGHLIVRVEDKHEACGRLKVMQRKGVGLEKVKSLARGPRGSV